MAEIFQFKPKATLTAAENLGAFIAKCRDQLTVFGSELNWDAPVAKHNCVRQVRRYYAQTKTPRDARS
jgi:hypothetical protein